MKNCLFIIIVLLPLIVSADSKYNTIPRATIDSILQKEVKSSEDIDLLIDVVNGIGPSYTKYRVLKVLKLEPQWNEKQWYRFRVLHSAIKIYYSESREKSLEPFIEYIELADKEKLILPMHSPLGWIRNTFQDNHEERLKYYHKKLEHYRKNGPKENMATCFHGIAGYYLLTGNFNTAITYYLMAAEGYKDWDKVAYANEISVIGVCYFKWGNFVKAKEYLEQSISLREKYDPEYNNSTYYAKIFLAKIPRIQKIPYDALKMLKNLLREAKLDNSRYYTAVISLEMAQVYLDLNQPEESLTYLEESKKSGESINLKLQNTNSDYEIDYVYFRYFFQTNQINKAEKSLLNALKKARQQKAPVFIKSYHKELLVFYNATKQFDKSSDYGLKYLNISDSLTSVMNHNAIAKYEVDLMEFENREEIIRLQQKRKVNMLYSFFAILILVLTVIGLYLNRNLNKAEARRLQELDTVKNRLYTNITHEFRTPLTVISGMTDQIEENPKEWFKDGLSMIRRNTNRLLELVNQMLDLTKLESGKTLLNNQQGDIITYLKYIVESIHSFAESKKIQVHFHEEGEELMMDFDPEKIQQIMINLLSNAVKFTPSEGHIYVHVRAVAEKDSPQKGSKLQIKVKNTGVGIPADQLPYIFDRFYQVDDSTTRAGEGSGIGLALVKELVKLMKGDISVKSKVGKETEFTILLPISNVAPKGQIPVPSFKYEAVGLAGANNNNIPTNFEKEVPDTTLGATKPIVLLVEDNPDVVAYTASCLQGQYEIQVAKDGQEGIDMAIENIPDLIITDVMMPYKDGFEVCQTLKTDQRTSHIPIIMLTAKADMESKIKGLEKGADAYLAKPFHKQELLTRIKKLLELRANLQKHYLAIAGSNARENNVINTPETPAVEDKFILKLREVVEAHLDNFDFTVDQFCKEVAMSHSQLHRKITALTGLSPNKFIRHVRLTKAKVLLQNSELTINAVAYETGFNDPGYFGRVFKREFGVTPLEWRERSKF